MEKRYWIDAKAESNGELSVPRLAGSQDCMESMC